MISKPPEPRPGDGDALDDRPRLADALARVRVEAGIVGHGLDVGELLGVVVGDDRAPHRVVHVVSERVQAGLDDLRQRDLSLHGNRAPLPMSLSEYRRDGRARSFLRVTAAQREAERQAQEVDDETVRGVPGNREDRGHDVLGSPVAGAVVHVDARAWECWPSCATG